MSTATINITLPKREKERLSRLALQYGFSLPEFSSRILNELASEIPEESLNEYAHPNRLRASLNRALKDWRTGRVKSRL